MSVEAFDRSPPPLFHQGPSALSKLLFFTALSVLLMVSDIRFGVMQPVRSVIASVVYPIQWLARQPVEWVQSMQRDWVDVESAQQAQENAQYALLAQSLRASQVELLQQENERLRALLDLKPTTAPQGQVAQVLYDTADPFSHRVVIDRGQLKGVELGSPVLDELGVLGQVTRVYPLSAEVTLLSENDFSIPVQNARTGARSVAYGNSSSGSAHMELRYIATNDDIQQGDLLITSGIDGIYPAGVHVAVVREVDRRADSSFARIHCTPVARIQGARHVLVLKPAGQAAEAQDPSSPSSASRVRP